MNSVPMLATSVLESLPWLKASLPFWPLGAATLIGLMLATGVGRKLADKAVVLGVAISALISILVFLEFTGQKEPESANALTPGAHIVAQEHGAPVYEAPVGQPSSITSVLTLFNWISLGNGQFIPVNFYFDALTGVMLFVVTVVGLMVMIYSIGYMRDHHGHPERGYERFFAFLALFVFSMLILVLAGNFVLLYMGWELVGLCSYLLIGFYYAKPEAAAAAKKAFIVNRIGDFGFALGIFSIYYFLNPHFAANENPLDYTTVFNHAHLLQSMTVHTWFGDTTAATVVSLLLLCGALGKSAQFPLYVWLPDAMEGPTPVSALIHAATMVTAGVYMIARCAAIFMLSDTALNVIIVVGLIGALLAATMAVAQFDMKRILAYSTMSQLAFMFVALGCGAGAAAIFHLYTHAFFKALLFLTAGSVMHAMGGVIDLRYFSGLKHYLPKTYVQMLIGCLALAGFPLLAGFFSKDEIVHAAMQRSPIVGGLLLLTAFLTAYYTFRMFFLCFHGNTRLPKEAGDHPHESPPVMLAPLWFLAIGAVIAGYAGVFPLQHNFFNEYLSGSTVHMPHEHAEGGYTLYIISAAIAIAGIGLAWMQYGRAPADDPNARVLGPLFTLWNRKYYVDELYDRIFVRPLRAMGQIFFATDENGINGLIWIVAAVPRGLGASLKLLQRGALQTYALTMVLGVGVLLLLWRWLA